MKNFMAFIVGLSAVAIAPDVLDALGQTAPTFEVASVKENTSAQGMQRVGFAPGGRFTAVGASAKDLITVAYGTPQPLAAFRVLGGPGWIASDRFDVNAKAAGDPQPGPTGPPQELLLMVRSLLEDRFKLAAHTETRELPIYLLLPDRSDGKPGPQLQVSTVDCAALMRGRGGVPPPPPPPGVRPPCGSMGSPGRLSMGSATMTMLAMFLSRLTNRVVVDRTDWTDRFDGTLEFTPDQMMPLPPGPLPPGIQPPPTDGPSLFTALREQLGLKLESSRGPVDVVVVDHIEPPSPD
jgi:uncharacterized protein (TIGR03435 family)